MYQPVRAICSPGFSKATLIGAVIGGVIGGIILGAVGGILGYRIWKHPAKDIGPIR